MSLLLLHQQIFKSVPPTSLLFHFLTFNSTPFTDHFFFSSTLYKQALFHGAIAPFIKDLEPHYHASKKHYINRKMDYNKFVTIIRQICNSNNITYTKKMVYHNSSYEIVYYIFLNPGINNALEDVSNNIIN